MRLFFRRSDEGSPATAVQIGDPITQKKFSDAIIRDIRKLGLYRAITDNGAGGLSSSVGEMAESSAGSMLNWIRYRSNTPVWRHGNLISESQERMTLAVLPENTDRFIALCPAGSRSHCARHLHWIQAARILRGTARRSWIWQWDFLHDGVPETS
ncbi:MAG: AIR synthase-related protein [Alphaproteobacteria bacterium]